jgi:Zn ribbon nucleic-acid-binding protein
MEVDREPQIGQCPCCEKEQTVLYWNEKKQGWLCIKCRFKAARETN